MAKNHKCKVGDTVRVVNESWADGIGVYRATIRKITQRGEAPFITYFATLSWKGRSADKCTCEYGTEFECCNLRVA